MLFVGCKECVVRVEYVYVDIIDNISIMIIIIMICIGI